jgi:hypothetical protein
LDLKNKSYEFVKSCYKVFLYWEALEQVIDNISTPQKKKKELLILSKQGSQYQDHMQQNWDLKWVGFEKVLEHPQWCSVFDPAKLFFTSQFSCILCCHPWKWNSK